MTEKKFDTLAKREKYAAGILNAPRSQCGVCNRPTLRCICDLAASVGVHIATLRDGELRTDTAPTKQ
jgi:hypothetical protein